MLSPGLLGGREKMGHRQLCCGQRGSRHWCSRQCRGVLPPGRFSCAIWAGMLHEQCHAPLVTVSRVLGGCDSSPAPEQSAQGLTVFEEQDLFSSQEVALRFKTSQMYLLVRKLI